MKRYVDINDISDGRLYTHNEYAPIGTHGCSGCTDCCRVTDDTIHLDPFDIINLEKVQKMSAIELIQKGIIGITVVDGVITLYLCKNERTTSCVFLNSNNRCSIHAYRPGFCRMFPLGRLYDDDGSFDYFVQIHECPAKNKTNELIKNWLDISDIDRYESFIQNWHKTTKAISEFVVNSSNEKFINDLNMKMLNHFYLTQYQLDKDIFNQLSTKIQEWNDYIKN